VLGTSDDSSRIYFASEEVLAGPNPQGDLPTAGSPNLYLHEGGNFTFIGTLSSGDTEPPAGEYLSPIAAQPYRKTSRITPDGRHIAFMSSASLTGYDNTDINNGKADAEIFVFDATANGGEGQLRCVSCNPSGQRPTGRNLLLEEFPTSIWAAALLPPYQTELHGSRVLTDDGNRVFFESYEALLPADTNGKTDVYQWEASGSGDCTESVPAYSPINGGCLSLISSGESPSNSAFVDASPDGRDVFFTTGSSLVPQDPGLIDIYDAREGGGYPAPPGQPAACEGEACQGPLAAPNDPTPASAAFNGPGNVKEASKTRCAKGKSRRKGRCVAKKKPRKAQKQAHRAADNNRRTAR
jgi:hypothetical protein